MNYLTLRIVFFVSGIALILAVISLMRVQPISPFKANPTYMSYMDSQETAKKSTSEKQSNGKNVDKQQIRPNNRQRQRQQQQIQKVEETGEVIKQDNSVDIAKQKQETVPLQDKQQQKQQVNTTQRQQQQTDLLPKQQQQPKQNKQQQTPVPALTEKKQQLDDTDPKKQVESPQQKIGKTGEVVPLASSPSYASFEHRPDASLPELVESLREKLANVSEDELLPKVKTCATKDVLGGTCRQSPAMCKHQTQLPESLEERIKQLAFNPALQISEKHQAVIDSLTVQLQGRYDLIIVTGASSNHYYEVQKSLKYLHDSLYKEMTNFTVVVYDLGLTEEEVKMMKKFCRCQVIHFPFEEFPPHVRTMKCFGWKPVTIKAHIEQANVIGWFDASIRMHNLTEFYRILNNARTRGAQQRFYYRKVPNPRFTNKQMFYYYGDEPCAHWPYIQTETGFGLYNNEPLIRQALITPWAACGIIKECGCSADQAKVQGCPQLWKPNPELTYKYSHCHRADQSSISIIYAKLFNRAYHHVVVDVTLAVKVRRGDKIKYFDLAQRNKDGRIRTRDTFH